MLSLCGARRRRGGPPAADRRGAGRGSRCSGIVGAGQVRRARRQRRARRAHPRRQGEPAVGETPCSARRPPRGRSEGASGLLMSALPDSWSPSGPVGPRPDAGCALVRWPCRRRTVERSPAHAPRSTPRSLREPEGFPTGSVGCGADRRDQATSPSRRTYPTHRARCARAGPPRYRGGVRPERAVPATLPTAVRRAGHRLVAAWRAGRDTGGSP